MTVIANDRLPRSEGGSREFVGDDHGVEGVSFILVEAAPGRGPSLHRHAYAEICIVQEGQALYTLGDEQLEAARRRGRGRAAGRAARVRQHRRRARCARSTSTRARAS